MAALLTMYSSTTPETGGVGQRFERIATEPMTVWYTRFDGLKSLSQNEALLGAMIQAEERGLAHFRTEEGLHLFVKGAFPAISMDTPTPPEVFDLTNKVEDVEPMASLLAQQRIAFTPNLFHGYFVNGAGTVLEPGEEVFIQYQSTTLQAVQALADLEFEGYEAYFGDGLVELSGKFTPPAL